MNEKIEKLRYLWDGSEPGWVLMRHDYGPQEMSPYSIVNISTEEALLMGDNDLFLALIERLLAEGVPVVSSRPKET